VLRRLESAQTLGWQECEDMKFAGDIWAASNPHSSSLCVSV
jgi:hypothetical protein